MHGDLRNNVYIRQCVIKSSFVYAIIEISKQKMLGHLDQQSLAAVPYLANWTKNPPSSRIDPYDHAPSLAGWTQPFNSLWWEGGHHSHNFVIIVGQIAQNMQ